ncbi:MAG: hypothetical protein IT158_23930 [Bryobacterales bacterium]|nr:hypothetical protein [Bryobacterales bacterium]
MHRSLRSAFLLGCILIAAAPAQTGSDRGKTGEPSADLKPVRHPRVRLGGISLGAGYTHYGGSYWGYPYYSRYAYWPGFWTPGYWGYDPWWWYPAIHPGYFSGFAYAPYMGEVKLRAPEKAEVFLDGAYAGVSGKLKSMWLEPGAYNLELRSPAGSFQKRIYVLSGKTLSIKPEFSEQQP